MGRSEDGEFELILGNKQLLSVFFIVVVLLGVFFTMGYIVGKNSVPPDVLAGKREPIVVDPTESTGKQAPGSLVIPKPVPEESLRPVEPVRPASQDPVTTAPKQEAKKESKSEPKKVEAKKEPPKKEPVVEPAPAPVSAAGKRPILAASGEPASGQQFLQVVASTRPDCEIIADVLKRKGFSAVVVPGPSGGTLFRVLVGPLPDAATITKTRADLEGAGFQKPYLRKY